ncbi:NAD(P)/FAD-dependent oxidoreductase [Parachryseolinea silvisoli]|uniref:NAD(P)/FAD-dependent oxidoreductase n=1 Tax=Parachryseolinea silvisoli TaxID=2873601 RepID=UPI002265A6C0|nr:FAD-dependent oxidoreductase [Parachryseolinea silvisoli]MCD9018684.1 FAD-dependent oxidoreductase [Parachryseolinea silvisoli]
MKHIAVIGGGVIGLNTAYYLQQAGHRVTIFEKGRLDDTCSIGNAGMVVPSHIVPLAAPGMIAKGIRWMFNAKSPFYVRPRLSGDLIKWGLKFYNHANADHVHRSAPLLKEISLMSRDLFRQLKQAGEFDFGYEERGLLMLFQTAETEREEIEAAHLANRHGVKAEILTLAEVQKLEPDVRVTARGGVYFPGDAQLIPQQLVAGLAAHLQQNGVTIHTNQGVETIRTENDRIVHIVTGGVPQAFDEYIIATGAWSGEVCAQLNLGLPMQSGKGYSFTLQDVARNIRIPTLLLEGRVAVTPMGNALRFGGTMEIAGTDRSVNMNRVQGIVETIPKYYPDMNVGIPDVSTVWSGLRPCSPDGLPYIGRSRRYKNLILATGHSMMGVSLAPATGKLVSQIVDNTPTSMDITAFDPERFD